MMLGYFLARAGVEALPVETVLDGEIVAVTGDGIPSSGSLQNVGDGAEILFYAFDVPVLAGADLRSKPLATRREMLYELISKLPDDSSYKPGDRSGAWVKVRANRDQKLVIGGYIPGSTTFDSILVGYYDGSDPMYAGRIRNGFTSASRRTVFSNFEGSVDFQIPFLNLPDSGKGRWDEGLTAADMKKMNSV